MRFLHSLLLLISSLSLNAQSAQGYPPAGFRLSGGLGYFFAQNDIAPDRSESPLSLELDYQRPLGYRFSLVGGLGVQQREQELATMTQEFPNFPIGLIIIEYFDSENYTVQQTEVFLKLGAAYRVGRFSVGASVLPTVRLGNEVRYQFYRNFTVQSRPDAVIDETIKSGDIIDRSVLGGGPRSIQYNKNFHLQAEVNLGFQLTPRLSLSAAIRPMLGNYGLTYTNQSYCDDFICVDYDGSSQSVGSLRGTAALLQVGYHF